MSYCRFSCLNGYSEIYAYESGLGCVVHVASRRRGIGVFYESSELMITGAGTELGDDHPAMQIYRAHHRLNDMAQVEFEPIDHPDAGGHFTYDTPGEAADKLEELRAAGFIVPHHAITALRAEQKERDDS